MVTPRLHRRTLLAGLAAAPLVPSVTLADAALDLDWDDLLPPGQSTVERSLQGLLPHDETATLVSQQPASTGVRADLDGQVVRLPGFIVPIDYQGGAVSAFILVPYVGACIHVPPPPANQLVFVTTPTPYESAGLFEAIHVTGEIGISSISTQIADVGYALAADRIEPYRA